MTNDDTNLDEQEIGWIRSWENDQTSDEDLDKEVEEVFGISATATSQQSGKGATATPQTTQKENFPETTGLKARLQDASHQTTSPALPSLPSPPSRTPSDLDSDTIQSDLFEQQDFMQELFPEGEKHPRRVAIHEDDYDDPYIRSRKYTHQKHR